MQNSIVRKEKDLAEIPGNYQRTALANGKFYQKAWHRSRLEFVRKTISIRENDVVADIGCGSGIVVEEIAPFVKKVYGIDSSARAVKYCEDYFSNYGNVEILNGELSKTNILPGTISKIVCLEVLEHVYEAQLPSIFAHWRSLLKAGGEVLITTPNDFSIWPLLEWSVDRMKLFPKMAEDQHVSHWSRRKMCKILKENGFDVMRSGTFNLLSPVAFSVIGQLGRVVLEIEKTSLKEFGPLVWVVARRSI